FFILLLTIWLGFEEEWVFLFNTYVGGWLHLPDHWSIKLLIGIGLLGLLPLFYQWNKRCYQMTQTIWIILMFCLVVLFKYHIIPNTQYNPQKFISFITYFNLIFLVLLLFFSILLVNLIRIQIRKHANESKNKTTSLWQIDEPIKEHEDDVYEWRKDTEKLIKEMDALSLSECAFKIGIVAPWGAGKSSYLNLLKKELKTKEYIVIDFNPRNAKECLSIQELFFQTLSEQLKQYHSGLSSLFQKYMLALQLISPDGWLSRSLSAFRELGRKEIRKELNATIKDLPFKLVIVIEDLDRLVYEEILEIFKLLDASASFPNTIYLTAYDKEYLKNLFHSKKTFYIASPIFSDKFFDLEYPIPTISSRVLMNQLEKLVTEKLSLDKNNGIIRQHSSLFSKYLNNIRDIKRYVNLLVTDYFLVDKEIYIRDFLLISLIEYKSPEIHSDIYQNRTEKIVIEGYEEYKIKSDYGGFFLDIIKLLFPPDSSINPIEDEQGPKFLRNKKVFRKYYEMHSKPSTFVYDIIDLIKNGNIITVMEVIDSLFNNKNTSSLIDIKDIVNYFETTELKTFILRFTLFSHLRALLYLYSKYPTDQLIYRFCTIFFGSIDGGKSIQEKIIFRQGNTKDGVRREIKNILSEHPNYYATIEKLLEIISSRNKFITFKDPLLTSEELQELRTHLENSIEN
ncbi:MAG: P-loop NTPase fold protein, partial [Porphyromonas sp.]|nr:P-loop NTPase fold protein [Porphyromonas sp.]